ncbi:MAG TPA: hypothetical protein VFG66_12855 [Gemmatimonadales bacterium]|nr:hypothetical protein [Gemmatimonadales bacterium]
MANDALAVYLNDHLAGSVAALELIESLTAHEHGRPLEQTLLGLHRDISQDQETLRELLARLEADESTLKRAAAWLTEKAARVKLALAAREHPALARLEGLESLALGIQGKAGLWRALAEVARDEPRLAGREYGLLETRAIAQHALVERARVAAAREALVGEAGTEASGG